MGFDNWNVNANVTEIAIRKFIREQIPDEAVQRMSMHQEYVDDRDWIEALRPAVRDEEDFLEGTTPQYNSFSGSHSSGNRKRNEPTTAKITKNWKYTTKEKRVYQAKK